MDIVFFSGGGGSVTNCTLFCSTPELGALASFVFDGVWPLLYLWSVAMALISFWLHLVFLVVLVFHMPLYFTCFSVPFVVSEVLDSWR